MKESLRGSRDIYNFLGIILQTVNFDGRDGSFISLDDYIHHINRVAEVLFSFSF